MLCSIYKACCWSFMLDVILLCSQISFTQTENKLNITEPMLELLYFNMICSIYKTLFIMLASFIYTDRAQVWTWIRRNERGLLVSREWLCLVNLPRHAHSHAHWFHERRKKQPWFLPLQCHQRAHFSHPEAPCKTPHNIRPQSLCKHHESLVSSMLCVFLSLLQLQSQPISDQDFESDSPDEPQYTIYTARENIYNHQIIYISKIE